MIVLLFMNLKFRQSYAIIIIEANIKGLFLLFGYQYYLSNNQRLENYSRIRRSIYASTMQQIVTLLNGKDIYYELRRQFHHVLFFAF